MGDKMETLKSALGVFLRSIPSGHKFNIWSFRSSYSSLWNYAITYSEENLLAARNHVQRRSLAEMGGTGLLAALRAVIDARATNI
jgi:hypothetical protein